MILILEVNIHVKQSERLNHRTQAMAPSQMQRSQAFTNISQPGSAAESAEKALPSSMHRHGLPIEQIERDLREEARNRTQLPQHVDQRGVEAPRKRRFQEFALRPA